MGTKVTTKVFEDRIEQYVYRTDLLGQEVVWDGYKHEMDLRDQGVREGLIKLGWTPPDTNPLLSQLHKVIRECTQDPAMRSWLRPELEQLSYLLNKKPL